MSSASNPGTYGHFFSLGTEIREYCSTHFTLGRSSLLICQAGNNETESIFNFHSVVSYSLFLITRHVYALRLHVFSDLEQLRKIRRRSPHDDTEAFTVFLRSDVEAKYVPFYNCESITFMF